jgi:beta-mannosidase
MFANNMFPGDSDFRENIREEIKENVIRLRDHPSIALWVGNNEIYEGWINWGWKTKNEDVDKMIEAWYMMIFEGVIPQVIKDYDGTRHY